MIFGILKESDYENEERDGCKFSGLNFVGITAEHVISVPI